MKHLTWAGIKMGQKDFTLEGESWDFMVWGENGGLSVSPIQVGNSVSVFSKKYLQIYKVNSNT